MIGDVTVTAPNEPPTTPAATAGAPVVVDRAVLRAQARDLTRAAAARWLTPDLTTQLGRAITVSITRYTRTHRLAATGGGMAPRPPTSTHATTLKRTRWVTYTATPRSLRVGPEGHAWLSTDNTPG